MCRRDNSRKVAPSLNFFKASALASMPWASASNRRCWFITRSVSTSISARPLAPASFSIPTALICWASLVALARIRVASASCLAASRRDPAWVSMCRRVMLALFSSSMCRVSAWVWACRRSTSPRRLVSAMTRTASTSRSACSRCAVTCRRLISTCSTSLVFSAIAISRAPSSSSRARKR